MEMSDAALNILLQIQKEISTNTANTEALTKEIESRYNSLSTQIRDVKQANNDNISLQNVEIKKINTAVSKLTARADRWKHGIGAVLGLGGIALSLDWFFGFLGKLKGLFA